MKILLVALNAKYIHSNLAVHSLKAYAGKYADRIEILELTINHSKEMILSEIYRRKAEVVAFSCYIWNISMITSISAELKKVQPDVAIWFGGPEVSYDVEQRLRELPQLKGVMIGEGEQTFLELVEHYFEGKNSLSGIDGLAYKEDGDSIFFTKGREMMELDVIPFPYEDMETFKNRIIYYESSRGCPFSCSYCLSSVDKKVRFRGLQLVKRELKLFLDYQVPQVKFVDRTFNCNKKHSMAIWQWIKENDNGITNFHFEISADLLEEDELELLASLRPGQVQFEIGVQSTNPDTVAAIHRRTDFPKLVGNVAKIKKAKNIHQHLDLIAGLPKEGYAKFEKSFADVYQLHPDQLQLGFLKVLKGSPMQTDSEDYGIIYRDTPPYEVLQTQELSFDEVLKIKGVCEMVEVYYNSGQFVNTIRFLEHFYESPMRLYQAISDYYIKTGNYLLSHNRVKRYEILLEFYQKEVVDSTDSDCGELLEVMKELLLLDLYLREDMRTRPSFAAAGSKQSNLRYLYDKYQISGRQIHIEKFSYDVYTSAETGQAIRKNTILLFDYSRREPLNKTAGCMLLEPNTLPEQ